MRSNFKQLGVTLIELIVFIVIISVAIVGVLKVLEVTSRGSVDPMVTKQALSIADSLLSEIEQQPFTYCDPNDANASTATNAVVGSGGCATISQNSSSAPMPASESHYSNTNPFDNVYDYHGFTMPDANCAGICIAGDNTPLPNLSGYTATVTITKVGDQPPFNINESAVLKINVNVTGPANTSVKLTGYRVRYAPTI